MIIGVIGPNKEEIFDFMKKIENPKEIKKALFKVIIGTFAGHTVVACICGVCKVNAAAYAQYLISEFAVERIIVSGVAGAINSDLDIGDVVVPTRVCYHDVAYDILTKDAPYLADNYFYTDKEMLNSFSRVASGFHPYKIVFGDIVTGEAFIDQEGREYIIENFGPDAVDMETSAIAHVCFLNQIPFFVIRSITDTEKESGLDNFRNNLEKSCKIEIQLLEEFLKCI